MCSVSGGMPFSKFRTASSTASTMHCVASSRRDGKLYTSAFWEKESSSSNLLSSFIPQVPRRTERTTCPP
eukprot:4511490-Pyramimonas_sp.AAC.1